MRSRLLAFFILTAVTSVLSPTWARAQVTCIQAYLSDPNRTAALGFAPSDVESVVSRVANSIGLGPSGIRVRPIRILFA
jgi:hypothetical protein